MNENDRSNNDQGQRGFTPFPEQNEAGVDLTLLRANLKLTPAERLDRSDQATEETLRLMEYGRRHRERQRLRANGADAKGP